VTSGPRHRRRPRSDAGGGWRLLLKGEADVVAGLKNKLQSVMSNAIPDEVIAEQHRKMGEPGSAKGH
jgi:hypothetical protein